MSGEQRWKGSLEDGGEPSGLASEHEPPSTTQGRATDWVDDHDTDSRDMRPALGTRGEPGAWTASEPGAPVALAGGWADAQWSYLYKKHDTGYAATEPAPGQVAAANRRMRGAAVPTIHGPFIHAASWSWEVALYFWVGGIASGAGFVALACDVAGDHRSAAIARKVAFGTVLTAPPLLIADLGRPERFLNMMRIVKPRSPMNTGAWCLVAFSATSALSVGADLARKPRLARTAGAATALLGTYLGSYTGILLACTAVPVWSRGRVLIPRAFIGTAVATGAAATRLALVASGLPHRHPTRTALGGIETASMLFELSLSALGERRMGPAAGALHSGRPGQFFRGAQALVLLGFALRLAARRSSHPSGREHDLASVLYLVSGAGFRFAWLYAGRASATDDAAVAAMARGWRSLDDKREDPRQQRARSTRRPLLPLPAIARRAYGEALTRTSLAIERRLRRRRAE